MEITYNTNCWEKSWKVILQTDYLEKSIKNNDFKFHKRKLWINNVNDYDEVSYYAKKAIENGLITEFYNTEDYIDEAMEYFQLSKSSSSLGKGFPYSVGSLCAIYNCTTKYIIYFTDDAFVPQKFTGWIPTTLDFIEKNKNVVTGNLLWARSPNKIMEQVAKKEMYRETERFYVGYGFSDQNYLGLTSFYKNLNYNTIHHLADIRYKKQRKPGTSFEKRVEAWKLNNDFERATYKNGYYIHASTLKNYIKKLSGK